MAILRFPPLNSAEPHTGLIALGGDQEVESILLAYRSGIFPWPIPDEPLAWFAPPKRAVLFFNNYHQSRSFLRFKRQTNFTCSFDRAFADVIKLCASQHHRGPDGGTWITSDIIEAYQVLHAAGFAHSVEVWNAKELVGGLYGVSIGGMFAAESMFHSAPNASKLALDFLVENLQKRGASWIDTQVINPFTKTLGCVELRRNEFMTILKKALCEPALFN